MGNPALRADDSCPFAFFLRAHEPAPGENPLKARGPHPAE